jgi:hypothetical protein
MLNCGKVVKLSIPQTIKTFAILRCFHRAAALWPNAGSMIALVDQASGGNAFGRASGAA